MTNDDAQRLIDRYIAGRCTSEERAWVEDAYCRQAESEEAVVDGVQQEAIKTNVRYYLRKYVHDSRHDHQSLKRSRQLWYWSAAAVVLLMATTWFFLDDKVQEASTITNVESKDIVHGGNRAILTLADGQTIELNEVQSRVIVGDNLRYPDGTLVVEGSRNEVKEDDTYELSTPKGGTYQVTLPDGTQVWLNAGSTLKYPNRFDDKERVVELEGEGYFYIARELNRPFKVISRDQEVDVLGTEFNLSVYADEPLIKTTLVKGSVRVVSGTEEMILVPGEQSQISSSGLTKASVNLKKELAWKTGLFYFEGTSFEELLRQVSRWYDVTVRYEGAVPQASFSGIMSRDVSLKTLLDYLSESTVSFELTEDRILLVKSTSP